MAVQNTAGKKHFRYYEVSDIVPFDLIFSTSSTSSPSSTWGTSFTLGIAFMLWDALGTPSRSCPAVKCSRCQQPGHTARRCTTVLEEEEDTSDNGKDFNNACCVSTLLLPPPPNERLKLGDIAYSSIGAVVVVPGAND